MATTTVNPVQPAVETAGTKLSKLEQQLAALATMMAAQAANSQALEAKLAEAMSGKTSAKQAPAAKATEKPITMKVSEKGALSVYGLGHWPVTLYKSQWVRLIAEVKAIDAFLKAHDGELASKS